MKAKPGDKKKASRVFPGLNTGDTTRKLYIPEIFFSL